MAGVAKKHLVDGRWVTVEEMATELGLKRQQLYMQMWHKGVSLQVVVNLYRENLILHNQHKSYRYMVDGRWMTINQAAEKLGVSPDAVYSTMFRRGCTLAQAVEAYRHGEIHRGGSEPKRYRVGSRSMTSYEAAEMLGMSWYTLRSHMRRSGDSLAATIRYYERKKAKRAEKAILKILKEGKSRGKGSEVRDMEV